MSSTLPAGSFLNPNFGCVMDNSIVQRASVDFDQRQPSILSGIELPAAPPTGDVNFDQRNLPVELAIRKFESLNKRPNTQPTSSPTNTSTVAGSLSLTRANTINNGSISPTNTSALHRFNSLTNNLSVANQQAASLPCSDNQLNNPQK